MLERIVPGILFAILVSYIAVKYKFLTPKGGFAAMVVGGVIFISGGVLWSAVLISFFFSSSIFSIIFKNKKAKAELKYAKGSQRDAVQVLANGGLGALISIIHIISPQATWPWWAFLAVMATVTADTWATEIGGLSNTLPINIRTLTRVEKGTSGGVSFLGLIASFLGALMIASFGYFSVSPSNIYFSILIIAVLGWLGALIDSWLGATIQAIYFDESLGIEVEKPPTKNSVPIRGWRWMNNDLVNFISAFMAGLLAIVIL